MKYAIVIRNVADLRARPDFSSERKNQLLFGEPIEVSKISNGYCHIYQKDGYNGWIDERAISYLNYRDFRIYSNTKRIPVISKTARIKPINSGKFDFPVFLFYSTRLPVRRLNTQRARAILPIKGNFSISLSSVAKSGIKLRKNKIPGFLIREARKFIGVPYLWGGKTPFGFDCSGLVQTIYGMAGIILPRDSKDQRNKGIRISRENIQSGDLLFFKGHVAIAINKYRIIHASLGGGGVTVNSLRPGDRDFRKDLFDTYIVARRLIK